MKLTTWNDIGRLHAKLLHREWIGNLLFCGVLGLITYRALSAVGFFAPASAEAGERFTAAQFPFIAMFYLSWMQYFPLIFLAASFFFKGKIDTRQSLLVRPTSNVGYYLAAGWGFIRVFLTWNAMTCFTVMFIHAIGSKAPFHAELYLYYLATLVMPATLFMTGWAFFLFSVTRSAMAGIVLLFGSVWATVNLSENSWIRMLNFTGGTLPNEYSEITGFSEPGIYLLQRAGWSLLGGGLLLFSALRSRRLENSPALHRSNQRCTLLWMTAGAFCLAGAMGIYIERDIRRDSYAKVFNQYAEQPKLYLLEEELEITTKKHEIQGRAQLRLWNNTGKELQSFVLYLNPSLHVATLRVEGATQTFRRNRQAIEVTHRVPAGDTLRVEMSYAGGIDEQVFYLDVPDEEIKNAWNWFSSEQLYTQGKKYAYLESRQVLLYPEALWYPMSTPPVNPQSPHAAVPQFSRYTLKVNETAGRTIISQGRREEENGQIVFRNDTPLSGITLCAGPYERRQVRVDSIYVGPPTYFRRQPLELELYMYEGQFPLVDFYSEAFHPKIMTEWAIYRYRRESEMNLTYPFQRLLLVQTPLALTTYHRSHKGSAYVQPELLCFPEKMTPRWENHRKTLNQYPEEERRMRSFRTLENTLLNHIHLKELYVFRPPAEKKYWNQWLPGGMVQPEKINNPFYMAPLFHQHTYAFHSNEYPGINTILFKLISNVDHRSSQPPLGNRDIRTACHVFGKHSLEEIFSNPPTDPVLMDLLLEAKSDELHLLLNQQGVFTWDLTKVLQQLVETKRSSYIHLRDVLQMLQDSLQVDLSSALPQWYHGKDLPAYIVKDIEVQQEKVSRSKYRTRYSFTVFNESDVDGTIYLHYQIQNFRLYLKPMRRTICYTIPARKGKRIHQFIPENHDNPLLHFGISRNFPLSINMNAFIQDGKISDTINRETPIHREALFSSDEIIVDNADEGFNRGKASLTLFQKWKQQQEEKAVAKKSRISIQAPNYQWQLEFNSTAYGLITRTSLQKKVRNQDAPISWTAHIQQAGKYRLYAYILPYQIRRTKFLLQHNKIPFNSIEQHYTVEHDGKQTTIPLPLDDKEEGEWKLLGVFDLPQGATRVLLHDKGINEQLLWADAIKWEKAK